MNLFWQLNKNKIVRMFLFYSLISMIFTIIILAISLYQNQFPHSNLLINILFVSTLIIPTFLSSITIIFWILDNKKYLKLIKTTSLNELEKLGFKYMNVNENSKWFFTTQNLFKEINSFNVILEINKDIISFSFFGFHTGIEKSKFNELKKKVKAFDFNVYFVGNFISETKLKHLTDIKVNKQINNIELLTELLVQYGYTGKN